MMQRCIERRRTPLDCCLLGLVIVVFLCVVLFTPGSCPRQPLKPLLSCDLEQPPPVHGKKATGLQCATTFVTQYFHIPSKHGHEEYTGWIRNIPPAWCMLVFTDTPSLWNGSNRVLVDTSLCREGGALNRSQCFWRDQWEHDPEAAIHKDFRLYVVWNLKARFLSEAVRLDPFRSDFFFWMDAGYARAPLRVDGLAFTPMTSIDRTKMHFLLVNRFPRAELNGNFHYTLYQDRLAGNLFGGHRGAVVEWARVYYLVLQDYVDRGWFVGKDQNIMNTLCVEHPSLCLAVDPLLPSYVNPWFTLWGCLQGSRLCSFLPMNETWTDMPWAFRTPVVDAD